MALTKIPLKNKSHVLYLENNNGLLFNQFTRTLFSLDPLLVAILLLIDDGLNKNDVLASLQKKIKQPKVDLAKHYKMVVKMLSQDSSSARYADGEYPELTALKNQFNSGEFPESTHATYKIANVAFSIQGAEHLTQDIHSLLAPIKNPVETIHFNIKIEQKNNHYFVYANTLLVEQCQRYEEVIPLVIDRLQILAFQKTNYKFCFHGAALLTSKGNLLLPGESGAGKSTLSALLLDKDHKLYSDEIIALDDSFNITTIPLPIAIKSGSWHIVAKKYPQIMQQSTWRRIDGRQLRYLWPEEFAQENCMPNAANLIINPKYSEHISTSKIDVLSVIDTIGLLTKSGYQLGFELNIEKLDSFIHFIQQSSHYRVTYKDSHEVKQVLESLW